MIDFRPYTLHCKVCCVVLASDYTDPSLAKHIDDILIWKIKFIRIEEHHHFILTVKLTYHVQIHQQNTAIDVAEDIFAIIRLNHSGVHKPIHVHVEQISDIIVHNGIAIKPQQPVFIWENCTENTPHQSHVSPLTAVIRRSFCEKSLVTHIDKMHIFRQRIREFIVLNQQENPVNLVVN